MRLEGKDAAYAYSSNRLVMSSGLGAQFETLCGVPHQDKSMLHQSRMRGSTWVLAVRIR